MTVAELPRRLMSPCIRRAALMLVEDTFLRFELDALLGAVEQLAQALHRTQGEPAQLRLDSAGTPILLPGLALQPGSQCPHCTRSKISFLLCEVGEHLEWTPNLLKSRAARNSPGVGG